MKRLFLAIFACAALAWMAAPANADHLRRTCPTYGYGYGYGGIVVYPRVQIGVGQSYGFQQGLGVHRTLRQAYRGHDHQHGVERRDYRSYRDRDLYYGGRGSSYGFRF